MVRSQPDLLLPRSPETPQDIVPFITQRLRDRDGDQFAENLLRYLRGSDGDNSGTLEARMTDLESRISGQMADLSGQVADLRQRLDTGVAAPAGNPPTYPAYEEFTPGASRVIPLEILVQADELQRKGMPYSRIVKALRLSWSSTTLRSAVQRRRERLGLS